MQVRTIGTTGIPDMSTLPLLLPPPPRPRLSVSGAALAAAVLLAAVLAAALATGHQLLIVRSGSMAPTIQTGDAVVTRSTTANAVQVGEVLTFTDPFRPDRLLTHRVRELQPHAVTVEFVTQGDANTGAERWAMSREGTLGTLALRIPKLGYTLALLQTAGVRVGLVAAAAVLLGFAALRRIWATG
jgi:signal peptidase